MLIVNFQPFPELYAERLRLRRLVDTDIDNMFAIRSDEAMMQFMDMWKVETYLEAKQNWKK